MDPILFIFLLVFSIFIVYHIKINSFYMDLIDHNLTLTYYQYREIYSYFKSLEVFEDKDLNFLHTSYLFSVGNKLLIQSFNPFHYILKKSSLIFFLDVNKEEIEKIYDKIKGLRNA